MRLIDKILGKKDNPKNMKDNIVYNREKSVRELSDVNVRLISMIEGGQIETIIKKLDIIRKE